MIIRECASNHYVRLPLTLHTANTYFFLSRDGFSNIKLHSISSVKASLSLLQTSGSSFTHKYVQTAFHLQFYHCIDTRKMVPITGRASSVLDNILCTYVRFQIERRKRRRQNNNRPFNLPQM